ncbi:MAG: hypothetical protein PHX21_11845 [bacterium]|nr:hypothetical protein [bacterium]
MKTVSIANFFIVVLFLIAGCAPFPVSDLEVPMIEKGMNIKAGTEMLNPQINDYVNDNDTSEMEFLKSSCIIFQVTKGKEYYSTWPFATRFRYECGFGSNILYPHPAPPDFISENRDSIGAGASLLEDVFYEAYFYQKIQVKGIALCHKVKPGSLGINECISFVFSPFYGNKVFIPYIGGGVSWGYIKGSTGIGWVWNKKLRILCEASYVYFPRNTTTEMYTTPKVKYYYPVIGAGIKYNLSK